VFDTLFAMDSKGAIHPQMVDSVRTSADQLTWDFTLRPGLSFHDGAPVTAEDCIASLRRWGPLDSLGRMLTAATETMTANGADSFSITLKHPFPLMLDVLGKPNAAVPFIMPARILPAKAGERIKDIVGSGPFAFDASRWRPGDTMVLTRNGRYVPRTEPVDFLAGGKQVLIDELVLKVMPDDSTGASALIAGEIDYMQFLPFDWLGRLQSAPDLSVMTLTGSDMYPRSAASYGNWSIRRKSCRPSEYPIVSGSTPAHRSGCAVRRWKPMPAPRLPASRSKAPGRLCPPPPTRVNR
jgi:peptide/nickel transport system substrate-binding protein